MTLQDNTDVRPSQALQGVHIEKLLDAILPLGTQYSKTKSDTPLLQFDQLDYYNNRTALIPRANREKKKKLKMKKEEMWLLENVLELISLKVSLVASLYLVL